MEFILNYINNINIPLISKEKSLNGQTDKRTSGIFFTFLGFENPKKSQKDKKPHIPLGKGRIKVTEYINICIVCRVIEPTPTAVFDCLHLFLKQKSLALYTPRSPQTPPTPWQLPVLPPSTIHILLAALLLYWHCCC